MIECSESVLIRYMTIIKKPPIFLAYGEHYLEYATFPSHAIAVAGLWQAHSGWVWAFLVYSIVAAGWFLAAYHRRYAAVHGAHADIQRMFEWLERRPPGLVWPIGSLHWQTLYYSRFPVLTVGANIDPSRLPLDEFMLVAGRYPYPSAEFERILEQYRVRY